MILLIDNEDSFVHTLERYVTLAGHDCNVVRNNELKDLPSHIYGLIISPGPKAPKDVPETNRIISEYASKLPILGVCLGHQCIGHVFGASIIKTPPVHGKTSAIDFDERSSLFKNIPQGSEFTRYHSLSVTGLENSNLKQIASTKDGIVMGIKHKEYECYGVQFHPESILSQHGQTLIENFLSKCN